MIKKGNLLFFLILSIAYSGFTQDIYTPINILQAIDYGSRTDNGFPGPAYFQNHANYHIKAQVLPKQEQLLGWEKITYFNQSNDTLNRLVVRLYQNTFAKGGLRDAEEDPVNINDGVIINQFLIDDFNALTSKPVLKKEGTNLIVILKKPLLPHDSCEITISWVLNLPKTPVHRFGKYDENTWLLAYWYPQVAVYDDIDGWDMLNYNGTQESYNDFNNYQTEITVPGGFMVWQTGEWKNAEHILASGPLKIYSEALTSDLVKQVYSEADLKSKSVFKKSKTLTYQYTAKNIPDIALAVSDTYVWDATSLVVDSTSNNRILVSAAYPPDSRDFGTVDSLAREIILHLSTDNFQIPFPFPAMTVFNGSDGEGMEFPMMVNNGSMFFREGTIYLTLHEIAHTYFPFLTGINERKYSWMDEGLTTLLCLNTEEAMNSSFFPMETMVILFDNFSGNEMDIPLLIPAYQTRETSYQNYSYFRPCVAFSMLEKYMGADTFKIAIKDFITTWQYKHPTPYDLFAVLQRNTSHDISWFIDRWFLKPGWADLAFEEVSQNSSLNITIRNKGYLPVPVIIKIIYANNQSEVIEYSPEVWKNSDILTITYENKRRIKSIELGNREIPDKFRDNNTHTF